MLPNTPSRSHPLRLTLASLVSAAVLGLAAPLHAEEGITINFVNADIPSVVKAIGGPMGKNFIIDPRVMGNINIVSNTPVPKELAYQILLSTLRVHGYAAIEEAGAVKIVPEADAKTQGTVVDAGTKVSGDRIVTEVFMLQNESAAQLVTILRPLVAPNNFIGAYPGNNALVITDYAENVKRIARILASIDVPASVDVQVIKLANASAVDVANLLTRLMPEANANPTTPGQLPKLAIGVEPRTNSLVIRADTPALVTRLKALVAGIDIPTSANGNINVVYLRNAEAAKVAETLRGLLAGGSASTTNPVSPSLTASSGSASISGTSAATATSSTPVASSIQAYPATNSLVIVAPDHVYNALRAVIDKLDVRRAQVMVEALVVEVSSSAAASFGIQWQGLSGINRSGTQLIGGTNFGARGDGTNIIDAATSSVVSGTTTTVSGLSNLAGGLNLGLVRGTITLPDGTQVLNLGMLASALESNSKNNVLSTPTILTLDNEQATIVVGQNVPFVTGSYTQTTTTATSPFQTIERKDVGLTLKVTPQVSESGTVKMKIYQEVSSVVPASSTIKSADLITNKRSIENTVLVDDGQTIVIGGLIQDSTVNGDDKVPLLGDIPVIGNLFKSQTKSRDKTNVMVFLRPVVLRDGQAANRITDERYKYIRNEQGAAVQESSNLLPPVGGPQLPAQPSAPSAAPVTDQKAAEKK